MAMIMIARQLAFGHGAAVSPANLAAGAQAIVVSGWLVGGALGAWLAIWLAKRPAPGLVVCAWLFQMARLSPGVRPAEWEVRLACSIAVFLAGGVALILPRFMTLKRNAAQDTGGA